MPNLNNEDLSEQPLNLRVNELIEAVEPPSPNYREYLGASLIGNECPRRIQYTWFCDPKFPMRAKDIFARGHFFEGVMRQHLVDAGFRFADPEKLAFSAELLPRIVDNPEDWRCKMCPWRERCYR